MDPLHLKKTSAKEEQWTVSSEADNTKVTLKKTIVGLFSLGKLYIYH
jgi:hypothetical protein